MKNKLILAILALNSLNTPVFALKHYNNAPTWANRAYTAFMGSFKSNNRSKIDGFMSSKEYKELKNSLENSLKANSNYSENRLLNGNIKIDLPVLAFAKSLKAKLSQRTTMVKDLKSTDKLLIDQVEMATVNNSGYFEVLKVYNLHQVFLYTLDNLTKEQLEIIEMANKLGDILNNMMFIECAFRAKTNDLLAKNPNSFEPFETEYNKIKFSVLMQKLRDEERAASKFANTNSNASWVECEKMVPNFRLFVQALEIKLTYEEEVIRKFNLGASNGLGYYKYAMSFFSMPHVLKRLGFDN